MADTSAPAAPAAAAIDPATLQAQIAAANKSLAIQRAPLLAALLAKVQAADLNGIAADLNAVRALQTNDKDLMVFKLHADIHGATEQMLIDAITANAAAAAD